MIHTLSSRFDVTVEHGAGAAAAHLMPHAMHIEPFGGGLFAATNLITHDGIENFGAAAGDRTETRFAQSLQRVADRHAKDSLRQMTNLDGGKCLDVKLRIKCAQTTQKIEIPVLL